MAAARYRGTPREKGPRPRGAGCRQRRAPAQVRVARGSAARPAPEAAVEAVSWRGKGLGNNEIRSDKVTGPLCGAAPCPHARAVGSRAGGPGLCRAAAAGTLALQGTATRCSQCQPRALRPPPRRCGIKILPRPGR